MIKHRLSFSAAAVAALVIFSPSEMAAQEEAPHPWIWRSGQPHGGIVHAIGHNGVIALALSHDEQFLSVSSDGEHWRNMPFVSPQRLRGPLHWTGSRWICFGELSDILTSTDGREWTRATTAPEHPFAVASNGSQTVVVGHRGFILTSPDGMAWTLRASASTNESLYSVLWTGSRFMAAGGDRNTSTGSLIKTSADGITWTASHPPGMGHSVTDLQMGGGGMVASVYNITQENSDFWYSSDGDTWTRSTGWDGSIWAGTGRIVHTGSEWIAVAAAEPWPSLSLQGIPTMRSSTGALWQPGTSGAAQFSLTNFGGRTLAAGVRGISRLSYDDDGALRWDAPARLTDGTLTSVVWTGERVVAAGNEGDQGVVLNSPDGIHWTRLDTGAMFDNSSIRAMLWTGRRLYAVGSSDGAPAAWSSGNGLIWDVLSTGAWGGPFTGSSGSSSFVITGPGTAIVSAAWNGRRLAFINDCGEIAHSRDGESWQHVTVAGCNQTTGIGWNGSLWIVSGLEAIGSSPDLVNWVTWNQTSYGWPNFTKVIVVGNQAFMPWSDGSMRITGANQDPQFVDDFSPFAVASSGTTVAVTYWDGVRTAPADMMTWWPPPGLQHTSFTLHSVCWTGDQFVAVGEGGAILTSGAPKAPRFTYDNGQVTLNWERFSNFDEYTVETSSDLGTWTPAGPPVTGTEQWSAFASDLGPRRFFKVTGK